MMDNLPEEVLLEIFKHLLVTDLMNLSKISRRFKDVICCSPKLWNFNVEFDKKGKIKSESTKWLGQLTVRHFNGRRHRSALTICGSNITRINFIGTTLNAPFLGSELKFSDIALILRLCPNVQHVKFENLVVWPEVIRNLPQISDIHVEIVESSACLLDLFLRSKVTALWITSKEGEYGTGIRGFLRSQPYLKTILCQGYKVLDLFYSMGNSYGENYELLPFQLKILSIRNVFFKSQNIDLLLPSAKSLTYLTIADVDPMWMHHIIADFISSCTHLEELSLKNFKYLRLQPPSTVTRVTVCDYVGTATWIGELTNLKTLTVMEQTHTIDDFAMIYDFSKNLELDSVTITTACLKNQLVMPYVKKLKLKDIRKVPDSQDMFKYLGRVEDVLIEKCGSLTDRIVKEVGRKAARLRNLSVYDGTLTNETVRNVRGCCWNLKSFNMKNVVIEDEIQG